MAARAWSCGACGALVRADEPECHRCGTARSPSEGGRAVEPGTPAEFVAAVHRTAVGPAWPDHEPIPDTVPAASRLSPPAQRTLPEAPVWLPPESAEASSPEPARSWRWLVVLLALGVLTGGVFAAYSLLDPVRRWVDDAFDALRG